MTEAQLKSHQARVFTDFPTKSVTIGATTYQCLELDDERGNEYGEGGLVSTRSVRVAIERSTIENSIPVQGTSATFRGETLTIGTVDRSDDAASITLTLEYPTRR